MHAAQNLYQRYTFIISHVSFHSSGIATKQRTCVIQSSRRRRVLQSAAALCARVPSLFCAGNRRGAEPLLLPESYIWCKFNHTTDCTLIRRVASRGSHFVWGPTPARRTLPARRHLNTLSAKFFLFSSESSESREMMFPACLSASCN